MASSLLEDALSQNTGAGVGTSSDFIKYIMETKIPGVHFHLADDGVGSPKATAGAAGSSSPPLVDGAHGGYMIPGLCEEDWASSNAVLRILREKENASSTTGKGSHVGNGKPKVEVLHYESLRYLERNRFSLMKNLDDAEENCSMLLSIADSLTVLPPPNDPSPRDVLNMAKWKDSLGELIEEMKTVEERCHPSVLRAPGVYVLTSTPYSAFLRALAADIHDRA